MQIFKLLPFVAIVSVAGTAIAKPIQLVRRDDIVIGVRHMSKEEADAIKNNGDKLVYDADKGNQGGELGEGIYVTTNGLEYNYESKGKHAVISIDEDDWKEIVKMYIPEEWVKDDEKINLMGQGDKIREYIEEQGGDADEVIRLKDGPGSDGKWGQFLIPGGIVEKYAFKVKIHDSMESSDVSGVEISMTDWDKVEDEREEAEEDVEDLSSSDEEDGDDDDDDADDGGFFDFDVGKAKI